MNNDWVQSGNFLLTFFCLGGTIMFSFPLGLSVFGFSSHLRTEIIVCLGKKNKKNRRNKSSSTNLGTISQVSNAGGQNNHCLVAQLLPK